MLKGEIEFPIQSENLRLLTHILHHVKVYTFGSWQLKKLKAKDVDIVVVSPDFAGVVNVKRVELVRRVLENQRVRIDPICLTQEEFLKLSLSSSKFAVTLKSRLSLVYETNADND
jgi:stress-induced morphogen